MPEQPNGMGQMIQMLSALSNMQAQRRELDLREKQFEQSKQQTTQAFGLQEKSDQYKRMMDFIDAAAKAPTELHSDLSDLASKVFPPEMAQTIAHIAMNAPQTLENLKAQMAAKGAPSVNPGEVAAAALTGRDQGQLGQSNMLNQMTQGPVTPAMQSAYMGKASDGLDPLTRALQLKIGSNPQLMNTMASIMAGGVSPYQQQEISLGQRNASISERNAATNEADLKQRGIMSELTLAKDMIIANMSKGKSATAQLQGLRILQNQAKMLSNPKLSPAEHMQMMADYNRMADQLGYPNLRHNGMADPSGQIDQMIQQLVPYEGTGGVQQQGVPQGPPQGNPMAPFLGRPPQ